MNDSPVDCQSRPRPARRRGIPYSAPRRRGLHLFATTFFVSQKTRRSPFRRSSSSEKRPFPPPRGFRPAGGALFLFSPMLASLAKGQGQRHSIEWRAPRAYLNFSFLIALFSHQGPLVKGGAPRPARFAFFRPKESPVLTFSACHFGKNVLYFAYK